MWVGPANTYITCIIQKTNYNWISNLHNTNRDRDTDRDRERKRERQRKTNNNNNIMDSRGKRKQIRGEDKAISHQHQHGMLHSSSSSSTSNNITCNMRVPCACLDGVRTCRNVMFRWCFGDECNAKCMMHLPRFQHTPTLLSGKFAISLATLREYGALQDKTHPTSNNTRSRSRISDR